MADFEIERPSVDVQPIQPTYNINTPSFTIEINGSTPGQRGEQGPPGQDGRDGIDGTNGIDGQDGVGVESIEQTSTSHESGGTNIITATLTDGSQSFFEIMNGEAGSDGGMETLTSPIILQELEDGFYRVPANTNVYGVEETEFDIQFTTNCSALLCITHEEVVDGDDPSTTYDLVSYYSIEDNGAYTSPSSYAIDPDCNVKIIYGAVCDDTGDEWTGGEISLKDLLKKTDVINNLTSTSTTKPLSAAQGKALKDLLDAIVVPTKTSDLTNDSGFITAETDPIYSSSAASGITSTDITNWNNKSTFSGNYNDLTNKPTIPNKTSQLTNDSNYVTSTNISDNIKASGYTTKTDPNLGTIEIVNYAKRYGGSNYAYLSSKTVAHTVGSNTDTLDNVINGKQETLVSGTNIKTINNQSILGPGNIDVSGGGSTPTDVRVNGTSITSNDVADIQVDGTYNSSTNKIATMSSLPTKVSDLSNDTGFITNTVNNLTNYYTKTNTYTKSEVDSLISAVSTMDIQVVQTLPTQDISTTTIYLVPKTVATNDAYDEYIYVNNSWEHIGSTEVDLSNYYTKTETDNLLDDKADLTDIQNDKSIARGIEYIIGTQTAATNRWTGVSTDTGCSNSALYVGKTIIYHLPQAGSSSAATLNLTLPDGTTTGNKNIYRLNNTTVTTNFVAGCDILMVYDGTQWKINAYVDTSGSNTIGYQLRTNSAIFKNKTGYAMNRYTLLFEVDDGLSGAATTVATGTTKTTVPFKYIPGGVIKYYSVSGSIANNANFTATGLWDQYTLNLGYTFNTGSILTSGKPVYMRCVVNSDGTLTPNYAGSPSHPIVQDLPTTEDGYVYVYLGQAYNTTNIELMYMHPIYEYKNGKIREYVDAAGGTVTETDPVFTASAAHGITSSDITNWNNKSDFSGNYNDLTNKPTIPTVNNATLTIQKNGTTVKTFTANASSNVTANITVPTTTSELTNNSNFVTSTNISDVIKSTSYVSDTDPDLGSIEIITGAERYGGTKDAYIGSYLVLHKDSNDNYHTLDTVIDSKQDVIDNNNKLSYAYLSGTPTIPTVNNSTITIQKNGTNVDSFTTNTSSNKSINITVPTKTSDITNDSGFVVSSSLATVATTGDYDDLTNKPTIPSLSGLIYTDVVTLASNLSVNANTNTATATYTLSPTSGYTAVMVTLENVYNGAINLWYCHLEDNKIAWRVRNVSNSNATGVSIRVAVLYVKTELVA